MRSTTSVAGWAWTSGSACGHWFSSELCSDTAGGRSSLRSDEVAQLSEVPPYGGLHEVGDAGIAMLPARYDLLNFFRERLWQVDRVILILPLRHSMKIKPLLV